VLLYAYHTDIHGYYPKSGKETGPQKMHGRLHGWCKTNDSGKYEILTIRPASYPKSTSPAHIHVIVKLPSGQAPFYINDFVFTDDPFVNEKYRPYLTGKMGGTGIIDLIKRENVWYGTRDMVMTK
jgi:protocatechuate 3,4-dioxygenase beta subunit